MTQRHPKYYSIFGGGLRYCGVSVDSTPPEFAYERLVLQLRWLFCMKAARASCLVIYDQSWYNSDWYSQINSVMKNCSVDTNLCTTKTIDFYFIYMPQPWNSFSWDVKGGKTKTKGSSVREQVQAAKDYSRQRKSATKNAAKIEYSGESPHKLSATTRSDFWHIFTNGHRN